MIKEPEIRIKKIDAGAIAHFERTFHDAPVLYYINGIDNGGLERLSEDIGYVLTNRRYKATIEELE